MRAFLPLSSKAASRSRTWSRTHADPSLVQPQRGLLRFEGQGSGSKRAKCCPLQYPAEVQFVLSAEAQLPLKAIKGGPWSRTARGSTLSVPRLGTTALRHVHTHGGAERASPSLQMRLLGQQRMKSTGSGRDWGIV